MSVSKDYANEIDMPRPQTSPVLLVVVIIASLILGGVIYMKAHDSSSAQIPKNQTAKTP